MIVENDCPPGCRSRIAASGRPGTVCTHDLDELESIDSVYKRPVFRSRSGTCPIRLGQAFCRALPKGSSQAVRL
jgi:hypothetical protein